MMKLIKYPMFVTLVFGIPLYIATATAMRTSNVLKWDQIGDQRRTEIQRYETLKRKVFQLADKDGIEGLSFRELDDLYTKAGVSPQIRGNEIVLPELTTENLEKAIQSYESERKNKS